MAWSTYRNCSVRGPGVAQTADPVDQLAKVVLGRPQKNTLYCLESRKSSLGRSGDTTQALVKDSLPTFSNNGSGPVEQESLPWGVCALACSMVGG